MERKYGPSITTDEVAQLLQGFGKLEMIRPAHTLELAQLNLNEGVMVQFQMYDDGQTALQVSSFFGHINEHRANFSGISQP
jgi:hypothetical protein